MRIQNKLGSQLIILLMVVDGANAQSAAGTAGFKIAKELEAGKVTKALAPTREINKLVSK